MQLSSQHFRNGATNASTITSAISTHPVHHLAAGDLGHTGLAATVNAFRTAWLTELGLRKKAATEAKLLLTSAASDTERIDTLLATAATRIGSKK
jgi:hypothetical protein